VRRFRTTSVRNARRALGAATLALAALSTLGAGAAWAQHLGLWQGVIRVGAHPLPVCLVWNHSVSGGLVADCLDADGDMLILRRSYLHDFAAGLGEVPGRGHLRPDPRGGYWIEGIDQSLPSGLALRVGGPAVAHRLARDPFQRDALPLPADLFGQRLHLRLDP
jgi:hypothetical protein